MEGAQQGGEKKEKGGHAEKTKSMTYGKRKVSFVKVAISMRLSKCTQESNDRGKYFQSSKSMSEALSNSGVTFPE